MAGRSHLQDGVPEQQPELRDALGPKSNPDTSQINPETQTPGEPKPLFSPSCETGSVKRH